MTRGTVCQVTLANGKTTRRDGSRDFLRIHPRRAKKIAPSLSVRKIMDMRSTWVAPLMNVDNVLIIIYGRKTPSVWFPSFTWAEIYQFRETIRHDHGVSAPQVVSINNDRPEHVQM